MDHDRFVQILKSFADDPSKVHIEKGKLVLQLRDELIYATLSQTNGEVRVSENDATFPAEEWIINRVAKLQTLADRILSHVPSEKWFVMPEGNLLDQLDEQPDETPTDVPDVLDTMQNILSRHTPGVCSILYLTSDAGEGKSTVINELARRQAELYRRRETSWLLVPISLGGRPFMRFDEVVVASLVNRLRFQMLYYDSFVELVKMGVLVPALDGFEEMFVERKTNEEAVSSLGNLLAQLQGKGEVLIAARKAYFEVQSLEAQGRLFDSLPDVQVSFGRLMISRWGERHFRKYCEKRGLRARDDIYGDVVERLGNPRHPLLTRAVLVRRLLDVAGEMQNRQRLLEKLRPEAEDYFSQFVETIIEREARDKWVNKRGDPPTPLLTVEEHHDLLGRIAEEMWINKTDALRSDYYDVVAEMFCEARKKGTVETRQIVERLKQHALIVQPDNGRQVLAFDHEEFRHFFLGEQVARWILAGAKSDVRSILRLDCLPIRALEIAAQYVRRLPERLAGVLEFVQEIGRSEGQASFTRENAGGLVIRLLDSVEHPPVTVAGLSFSENSLSCRHMKAVTFNDCHFQPTTLQATTLNGCRFLRCEFERLDVADCTVSNVGMDMETQIHCLAAGADDLQLFDPRQVRESLARKGFVWEGADVMNALPNELELRDDHLIVAIRAIRPFLRANHVNEDVIRLRLGDAAPFFLNDVLPRLLSCGVFEEARYAGRGNQRRFRLGRQMTAINAAMQAAHGSFDRFLEELAA